MNNLNNNQVWEQMTIEECAEIVLRNKSISESIEIQEQFLNGCKGLKNQNIKYLKIAKKNKNKEAIKYYSEMIKMDEELIVGSEKHIEYLRSQLW